MIFQFLNSDVDKWTTKIGILGKSFDSLGHSIKGALFESKVNENSSFWKILLNDLTPEKDDQWLRNSLGEIISQENIDNYIAELDLDSAKDKLKEIFNISDKVKDGTITWDKYFETQKNGNQYIIDTIKNTQDLSKLTGDDLVKANQKARDSAIAHNAALKQQTLGAKAANKALKGLAMVGNMLAVIVVAKGIELAVEAIDKYHVTLEEAQESLEESVDTFKEATESIKDLEDEVVTCTERIEELQNLANQGSISIADEKELELLKKTNDELERKLVLEREQQMNASKKVLKDANITSTKKVESDFLQSLKTGRFVDVLPYQELLAGIQDYEAAMSFKSKNPEGFESGNYVYDQDRVDKTSERIAEMYDIISPTLEAYRDLIKAGYELGGADKEIYEQLLSAEDAYLLHIYNVRGTEDAYRSLNEEQQRTIIFNRLLDKELNDAQANSVLNNINSDDLDELWDKDFSFVSPEFSDYDTTEEYGKAYAEAWLKGVASVQPETENTGFLSDNNIEAINDYQSELKQLYEVLNLLHSGVITGSDLDGLMETFPELSNYVDNLGEGIQKLIDDRLSKLKKTYNGLIGEDVLASIAEFYIKQEALDHSINTTASAIDSITSSYQSLNKAIEEYNENGYVSLKTLEEIMKLEPKYLSALMDEEGNIVANTYAYRDLLLIKLKEYELDAYKEANLTQSKLREQYAGDFYNPEYQRAFKESQKDLETKLKFTAGAITNIDELMKGLGSGSSSTSDFEQQIDWAANSVSNLEREVTNLENALADTKVWDKQIEKLGEVNQALGKVQTGYSESEKLYREEYNNILNSGVIADQGLSSQIREKIESGEVFDIEDFIDKNVTSGEEGIRQQIYNAIQKALDYFNKANDAEQNKVKIKADIEANDDQIKELRDKQYQFNWDEVESKQQTILNDIDYNGGKGTAEQYDQLIAYEQQLMEMEQERLKELESTLQELEPSTDEYKEQVDLINESKNRLAECKREIKDWGLEKVNRLLDAINDKLEEINEQIDANQDAIDAQDRFIAGAIGILNQEIEVQEELRDAIQDKIDALQKENDEHERALALEKAKYELERARSQRTVKLYSGKDRGFIYTQNEEDVRSAQEKLDELEFESTIHALEEQVEYYDKIIDNLNEIKDAWSEIASKAQEMLDIQYTLSVGGAGIRDAILGGTYDIEGFTNSYKNLLAEGERLEAQKQSWEDFYAAIEKAAKKFEWGITDYEECVDEMTGIVTEYSSLLEITEDEVDTVVQKILEEFGILGDPIDETKQKIDDLEKGTEEATDAMESEIKDVADVARDEAGNAASDVTGLLQTEAEAQKEVMQQFANDINATFSDMVSKATSDALGSFQALADGIASIASAVQAQISAMVSQAQSSIASMQSMAGIAESLNSDILEAAKNSTKISSAGSVSHSPGKKTIELKSNGGMLTTKDEELEQLAHSLGEDHITLLGYKDGERVLTPVQNEIWEKLVKNAPKLNSTQPHIFTPTLPKVNRVDNTVPVVQNVNLTLPNVTNENGYNKIISAMKELQMDAVQFSKKK